MSLPWHLILPSDILLVTTEGVHLTTEAALQLGGIIAVEMAKLVIAITPSSSGSKDTSITILRAAAANTTRERIEAGYASLWEQCQAASAKAQSQIVSADAGNDALPPSLFHWPTNAPTCSSYLSPLISTNPNINTIVIASAEGSFAARRQLPC